MGIPLDYEILRLIWWLLLGVLLIGFAVMDGFDLGVGALLPFVARNDDERRIVINVVGPVWEGNQVWLILGGGAIFAAWPALYAISFSGYMSRATAAWPSRRSSHSTAAKCAAWVHSSLGRLAPIRPRPARSTPASSAKAVILIPA